MSWLILLAEPNREVTAHQHLAQIGLTSYLPITSHSVEYRCRNGANRKRRNVLRPMFPGYLFLEEQNEIGDLRRVIGVKKTTPCLMVDGKPAILQDNEIQAIKASERRVENEGPFPYRSGDLVRVKEGAFGGFLARIHHLSEPERIWLLLDFLGRKAKLRVTAHQIEAASA